MSKESGYSLFEFALSIPIILGFILGIYDINNIYSTRAAVDEVARMAVRHLLAVDPNRVAEEAPKPQRVFEWKIYKWNRKEDPPQRELVRTVESVDMPIDCRPAKIKSGEVCVKTFKGFKEPPPPPEIDQYLQRVAENFVKDGLRALAPRARFQCVEPAGHCVTVEAHRIPGDESMLSVSVAYQQPMVVLDIGGDGMMQLESTRTLAR